MTAVPIDVRETIAMAEEDDRRTAAYRSAGLCDRCASHISKGHALGFIRVPGEPCSTCAPIVATFPEETSHPAWRKWPKGRPSKPSTRAAASPGVPATVEPLPGSTNTEAGAA